MSDPQGVSLGDLGLRAADGLDCPEGGLHHVLEFDLAIAKVEGGGSPVCRKCGRPVVLVSTRELW